MTYRRLGRSGLKVSLLSFGSWVTFKNQVNVDVAVEQLATAREYGVNFFDNAEAYAAGESERIMGKALDQLGWDRSSYVVSSKFFWGIKEGVNSKNTLNRKYLLESIDPSLERFGLDHLDLIFCHRPDPETPVEETVFAMHEIVASGKALYWGTSEWSADEIRAAWDVADRHGLHKPVMEQPQYNLFERQKVEQEYARLYEDIGLGLTTWSPLASGLLTGKYADGIPEGSRAEVLDWLRDRLTDEDANRTVKEFAQVADEIGCTPAQLAIAWCAANPNVSTVITGASKVEQIHDNMQALDVLAELTDERKERIEAIFD
jgi:voltage-dependent potassium channel beta subunit